MKIGFQFIYNQSKLLPEISYFQDVVTYLSIQRKPAIYENCLISKFGA